MLQHVIDMKKFDADADRCLGLVTIYEDSDTGTDAVVSSIASGSWLRDSASVDLCSEVTTSLEGEGERVLSVKPASCASVSTTSCGGSAASAGRSVGDIWPGGCGEGDDWFTGTALHFTSDRTGEVGGTTSDTIAGAASLPLALGTGGVGVMLVLSADPSTVTTLSTGKSIHPTNNKHFTAIVLEQTGWASTRKTCQNWLPTIRCFSLCPVTDIAATVAPIGMKFWWYISVPDSSPTLGVVPQGIPQIQNFGHLTANILKSQRQLELNINLMTAF